MSIADVVKVALDQVGKPYVWAKAGPDAFDCSGLIVYAFKKGAGVDLPHFTGALWNKGNRVPSRDQLQLGDLVFPSPSHVGIYVGNGQYVNAPHAGAKVRVEPIPAFWGARRIDVPGGIGNIHLPDIPGVPDLGDIKQEVEDVSNAVKAIYGFLEDINNALKWISEPANIRRVVIFSIGLAMVLFGLARIGFSGGSSAARTVASTVRKVANNG